MAEGRNAREGGRVVREWHGRGKGKVVEGRTKGLLVGQTQQEGLEGRKSNTG